MASSTKKIIKKLKGRIHVQNGIFSVFSSQNSVLLKIPKMKISNISENNIILLSKADKVLLWYSNFVGPDVSSDFSCNFSTIVILHHGLALEC
jgi:hypothetical protein